MRLESFLSSHIRLFGSNEFILLCQAFFVGLILCGGEIFHRHHGADIVVRRSALLGFPSFWMGDSRRFQKPLLAMFMRVKEWQHRCSSPIAASLPKSLESFFELRLMPQRSCFQVI
jgi:hypothetical protein